MLKISIIVFREVLEIAIVLGVLLVATQGLKGRNKWVIAGLGFGIVGSLILAFFTDNISSMLEGVGQEIFNAAILFTSSLMIAWTVIWMTKYGRKVSADLKQLGKKIADGHESEFALMPVIALTVLREGSEIVLFSYGSFVSGDKISDLVLGALIGLICGLVVGFAIYYGLIKVLGKHFFLVTSWLLIFLAAGMVSQSIGFLSSAGIVPEIIYPVWDSSSLILEDGITGKVLHALFGYISRPSLTQLIGYLLMFVLLVFGLNHSKKAAKN